MTAELRRSLFLACVGLLGGFALVVAMFGIGELFKRGLGSQDPSVPVAALPQGGDIKTPDTKTPESRSAESPSAPSSAVTPLASREEGGSMTPGKPLPDGRGTTGPAGTPDPAEAQAPTFDIIRVEPTGETVIAGRGAPNTTVELLRDNQPIARALIDPSGQFAIVPPALPAGNSEITLRSTGSDGQGRLAKESVVVVVAANRTEKPLIALTSPGKPTIVLSQPDSATASAAGPKAAETGKAGVDARAAANAAGAAGAQAKAGGNPGAGEAGAAVKIVSVDTEEGGRLYVTSQAPPGATVRLYLNDTLIAPGSVGADGRVSFTIGRGVTPGDYRIRVDQVDPVSGKVKTRSEVAFTVPANAKPVAHAVPDGAASGSRAPGAGSVAALSPPGRAAKSDAAGTRAAPLQPASPQAASPVTPPTPMTASPSQESPTTHDVARSSGAQVRSSSAQVRPSNAPVRSSNAQDDPSGLPQAVFVAEINTARITRGDSLWQISRRTYGKGTRYTVIFDANQTQIRNPDLIYPGQIFVLPSDGSAAVPLEQKRG